MIKFFRKIRQNLLMENKTGKYLKYAIGEIVLVMVGILLALQVNNWNENRKSEYVKQNYYKQLLIDLESDKNYAQLMISTLDSSITKHKNYIESLKQPYISSNESFNNVWKNNLFTRNLEFKTSTIKSLINTGDMSLLESNLRDKLTNYNGSKANLLSLSKTNNDDANDIYQSAFMRGVFLQFALEHQPEFANYLNVDNKRPEIFTKLHGYLSWRTFGEKGTIKRLSELIVDADIIIDLINENMKE
ncbi:hypothetical protein [Winogradskyella vincentii]|uniref:Uncharacterized protein n=1 Tax=Winogradskyella vincentii TaxID=2877122 RepID=A0ABS7Y6G0_9FLAO|nr:hypothetical protein [Winogradskyella vincentii]MCA0154273.1 hypothetical protein [Winogradskyella vincentii]